MARRFTFDGALMFGFRAAHAKSFPWKFALAFAVVSTALTALLAWLAKDAIFGFMDTVEQLDRAGADDPAQVFSVIFNLFGGLLPWFLLGALASLVVWAMFMAATQRRYIRDEAFSIRFGPDEFRMMVVGVVWYLGMSLMYVLPGLIMLPMFGMVSDFANGDISENEMAAFVLGRISIVALMFLVLFPAFVFFATRFSPVFAMTVKEGRIAFGDAWIVSRGRFWPILGGYLIIAIVGGLVVGFASSIVQMAVTPAFMGSVTQVEDASELRSIFTPALIVALLVYSFIRYFLSGLLMHFVQGPAAFAARHDPRGSIDDVLSVEEFN
nr:hypothetical protein [uncultured Hyphomonas sp.]